jgi:hypothetical protein
VKVLCQILEGNFVKHSRVIWSLMHFESRSILGEAGFGCAGHVRGWTTWTKWTAWTTGRSRRRLSLSGFEQSFSYLVPAHLHLFFKSP